MLRPLKRLVRQSIRRFGWDLRRIEHFGEPHLVDFLRLQAIDLVLDVGANEGQFAIALREKGYSGEIVSFEPIASVFKKLAACAARDQYWTARQVALGDRIGTAEMTVTADTVFSSLKPQSALLHGRHPDTAIVAHETVELTTVDRIFAVFGGRRVFLKIDAQGFEEQVLAGAETSLRHIAAVQLELPAVHFYEGVWSFGEAMIFMERSGFTLAQLHPVVWLPGEAAFAEVDCLFRRADDRER